VSGLPFAAAKRGDSRVWSTWKFELAGIIATRIRLTSANGSGTGGGQKQEEYGEKSPAPATEYRHSRHSRDECRGCQNTSASSPLISICVSRWGLPVHTRVQKKRSFEIAGSLGRLSLCRASRRWEYHGERNSQKDPRCFSSLASRYEEEKLRVIQRFEPVSNQSASK